MSELAPLFCINHPKTETYIRCGKCDQPICLKCRVETPVGMRCRQCGVYRPVQYQVPAYLYVPALVVGLVTGWLGGLIGTHFGFFTIILGPVIGTLVGEAIGRATRQKRGVGLAVIAAGAIVFGAFGPLLLRHAFVDVLTSPWVWLYVLFAAPAAFWRLR